VSVTAFEVERSKGGPAGMVQRRRVRVHGTVQGVGFRPFVHSLALRWGLTGSIGNDASGVWCEVQGPVEALDSFAASLRAEAPPLARVRDVEARAIAAVTGEAQFAIVASDEVGGGPPLPKTPASVPPDVAMCSECASEVADPADRRFGYPFTCCTDCGPRYTVLRSLPYDRHHTSMADFPLCESCRAEYSRPGDRRHHAQAICCPVCGPRLEMALTRRDLPRGARADADALRGDPLKRAFARAASAGARIDVDARSGDPLDDAFALIASGEIVAVKGMGGYQLVCRADDDRVVNRLRERKHRDHKPFALLVATLAQAEAIIELDDASRHALTGPEAPIVLGTRRPGARISPAVAPGLRLLGVMLPATPLHQLLAVGAEAPLVCTSGNLSDEPIAIDDADADDRLGVIASAVLSHDRRIERRADDSVGQAAHGQFRVLRRARGFVPRPVRLTRPGPAVLGVGAELKNTVCLALGDEAHISAHLGDLDHPLTLRVFEEAVADLLSLTGAEPELVVHDLHPEYLSSKFAGSQTLAPAVGVQHHHAHLAACLADNGHSGPAIGIIFDGLGWGADGTLWGGEFLTGDAGGVRRAAHLAPVPLPGGAAAIREPWRMAVAHLVRAVGGNLDGVDLIRRHRDRAGAVVELCSSAVSLRTSAMGRLFDAVAALCGLADEVSYDGQAASLLEQAAGATSRWYRWEASAGATLVIDPAPTVRAVVDDLGKGVDVGVIAGAFHAGLARMVVDVCRRLRDETGIATAALSGGVFQNRLLVELAAPALKAAGFAVLLHSQVPTNDGGISLGQVAVGRARLEASGTIPNSQRGSPTRPKPSTGSEEA